jgi:hypothetical protein
MPKFDVYVGKLDINEAEGFAGVFDRCPIACALKKLSCEKLDVDSERILLTFEGKRYVYQTPRVADLFIDDFDNGREVNPIEFVLENPKLATIEDERPSLLEKSYKDY